MSRFRRTALTATLVATLGTASAIAVTTPAMATTAPASTAAAPASMAAAASLPTAAVAMGDSFISGEGAGSYSAVVDINGVSRTFPGWSAPNNNAYFCHRSPNASIFKASLPGVSARFNIACSGGQPADMANASNARAGGREVASQLSQLRAIAQTNDIDVVLVGLGSNNSSFTFGDVASECANRFIADAWTGWWEFWAYINGPVEQDPCTAADLATSAEFAAATAETVAAVRQIVTTLREIDADGQHRIVLQDYTNPLPFDYASKFYDEDGRTDTRDKFRALGSERYTGGCPAHRASLAAGHAFSTGLGTLVKSVHTTLTAEFPTTNLVYLNVQQAFNGARLCEQSTSPTGALATPIRLMDGPTGVFLTSLSGYDKIDIQRIASSCVTYFQTCQESWHPNVAGHTVLGQCLAGAASTANKTVSCVRSSTGAITVS